ncbi:MAG: hypothetical protein WCQ54_00895 [Clostridiaceae bacterium]
MRNVIELNNDWYFKLDYNDGMEQNNIADDYEKYQMCFSVHGKLL